MYDLKKYMVLWLSQSVSQLGSSMTAFALILWIYQQSESAFAVSMISFCNYFPYIITSIFVGAFIDSHSQKAVMLISDSIAAFASLAVLILQMTGSLSVGGIYAVNIVAGITTAFQQPASSVAIAQIVPEEKLSKASGMNAFSNNLTIVFSPMLASALFSWGGLPIVLFLDLLSFVFAFGVLLFAVPIPKRTGKECQASPLCGIRTGFLFLKKEKGICQMMLTMAGINFLSRLTYENILSPMILARSCQNSVTLGLVNACMGIGGIVGGLLVTFRKESRNQVRMVYLSAGISFLFGDFGMAVGKNVFCWCFAALAASLPIPFVVAGQNVILYKRIPKSIQGRVFAVRNAVQFGAIPFGIILGGYLADYVFEPFMDSEAPLSVFIGKAVGTGDGSGMAAIFLCTGACGLLMCVCSLFSKELRKLDRRI